MAVNSPENLRPLAVTVSSTIGFVEHVIRHHSAPTTLVICSSRESFLKEMQTAICGARSDNQDDSSLDEESPHPLLVPTLHTIAETASINMVFTPSLPQLRAYLSIYHSQRTSQATPINLQNPGQRIPLLAILGLANLHRSTAEQSAQGISRTLSSAIEAAYHMKRRLILAEMPLPEVYEGRELPTVDVRNPWKEQISLLSGSVRVSGGQRVFAGRSVEVGDIVGKWCSFVSLYVEEQNV